MLEIVYTGDGKVFVSGRALWKLQREIDAMIEEDPYLYPIDAKTLVTLELSGYTWNFETGQVEPENV